VWCSEHLPLQSRPGCAGVGSAGRAPPSRSSGWLLPAQGPVPCLWKTLDINANTSEPNTKGNAATDAHLGSILSPWHALHHAALDNLKLEDRFKVSVGLDMQCKQPCDAADVSHLVVVSSLLDELVDYFLGLTVTFLLQVSNEYVQMARTVVCLYYRLMSLYNTSDTWKCRATH